MALSLAEVFRRFGPAYQQQYSQAMLPSHRRAISDIVACRTKALGGHLWLCRQCGREVYVYHGCRNRNCPDCHQSQTDNWLQLRQAELLDCPYFHLTATIPEPLRALFRSHQKILYALLMRLTAQCILNLSANRKRLGGMPGILAVLHTWTGKLDYHPHVHCLVTGGGVSPDQNHWLPTRPGFFLPVRVLSRHLRQLFQQKLQKRHPELYDQVPVQGWEQEWVVHCIPWGQGSSGVLEYLARYVHRIAITSRRLLGIDDHTVTFQFKDRKAGHMRTCQLEGQEFMRRFLQHVLPMGLHKVRYYGLWNPKHRELAERVRQLLRLQLLPSAPSPEPASGPPAQANAPCSPSRPFQPTCPGCGCRDLLHVKEIPRPHIRDP
jgi:hypothetical protein